MYDIAVIALIGLAIVELVGLAEELAPALDRYRGVLTVVLAVAAAVVLDYSLFDRYDVALSNDAFGPWMTGFAIAGTATLWRAVVSWLRRSAADDATVTAGRGPTRIAA